MINQKLNLDLNFLDRKRSGLHTDNSKNALRGKTFENKESKPNQGGLTHPNSATKCCTSSKRADKLTEDIRFAFIYEYNHKKIL